MLKVYYRQVVVLHQIEMPLNQILFPYQNIMDSLSKTTSISNVSMLYWKDLPHTQILINNRFTYLVAIPSPVPTSVPNLVPVTSLTELSSEKRMLHLHLKWLISSDLAPKPPMNRGNARNLCPRLPSYLIYSCIQTQGKVTMKSI